MLQVKPQTIDKQAVADSFSKAASHYDQFAQLQRDIGEQLLTQVTPPLTQAVNMVDLGCGTGYFSAKLALKFPHSALTCFDLSDEMLVQVKKRHIMNTSYQQGDIDSLPFFANSLDLIYSNLVVQWSADLSGCLTQVKNSLTQGGKGYLSTLLVGSLNELTQAWKSVDQHPHTNRFLDLQTVQKSVAQAGFSEVQLRTETRTLHYKSVIEVMRALKGIGASHVHGHQPVQMCGKKLLKQLEAGYQPYQNEDGLLKLTYEVCYIEVTK